MAIAHLYALGEDGPWLPVLAPHHIRIRSRADTGSKCRRTENTNQTRIHRLPIACIFRRFDCLHRYFFCFQCDSNGVRWAARASQLFPSLRTTMINATRLASPLMQHCSSFRLYILTRIPIIINDKSLCVEWGAAVRGNAAPTLAHINQFAKNHR